MTEKRMRNFRILEYKTNQFDIIGDIHGCYQEFMKLIEKLGYHKERDAYFHPEGRRLISVGDVADKGLENLKCLEFWMDQVANGGGFWIHGNHCHKLYRYFRGKKVHISHGMENTVAEFQNMSQEKRFEFKNRYMRCYESQCYYLLLDKQRLAVVHGGLLEESMGKFSNHIKDVCLYGESTGKFDDSGKPERVNWAMSYKGRAFVVYGHTVTGQPTIVNRTVDIDQGCVYGGKLTALRYPEMEFVQVTGREYAKFQGKGSLPLNNRHGT